MDKKDIIKAKNTGSRWITIYKNYPMFVMTESEMWKLDDSDDI